MACPSPSTVKGCEVGAEVLRPAHFAIGHHAQSLARLFEAEARGETR